MQVATWNECTSRRSSASLAQIRRRHENDMTCFSKACSLLCGSIWLLCICFYLFEERMKKLHDRVFHQCEVDCEIILINNGGLIRFAYGSSNLAMFVAIGLLLTNVYWKKVEFICGGGSWILHGKSISSVEYPDLHDSEVALVQGARGPRSMMPGLGRLCFFFFWVLRIQ